MAGERERLFVAAELPGRVAEELAWWARDTCGSDPALRLLPVASLHLTLAFLGLREPGDADVVGAALAAALGPAAAAPPAWPTDLGWEDAVWLPRRRPSVLAASLDDPAGALLPVREAVVAAVTDVVAWEPEARPFLAHVSVARVRGGARPRTLDLPLPSPERFGLSAVTLFRSSLSPEGADYTALASVPSQS